MVIIKVLNRGINLDVNPIINTKLQKEIHSYNPKKYGVINDSLSEIQSLEIHDYWSQYTLDFDINWMQFYFSRTGIFDVRYIPHDIFYSEIDRVLNSPYRALGLDDKRLYKRLFPDVRQPQIIVSKIGKNLYNKNGKTTNVETALDNCLLVSKLVCKEPINTCGGHNVKCLYLPNDKQKLLELLCGNNDLIFQECITQHKDLEIFHPKSVNTIRILSYLRENGEVVLLSSVLRMGSNGTFVDNVSSGGCTCGVDDTGELHATGFSNDLKPITHHPGGMAFKGHKIPDFDKVKQMVKEQHNSFPFFALLAWDCTVDNNGTPILIEVNMNNASIDFMQLNNGPLFGEYTAEILKRVYRCELIK